MERFASIKDSDKNCVKNSNSYDLEVINDENNINENISENDNGNDILEESASQSSLVTKNSANSFWNLNKKVDRDEQINFSSKSFIIYKFCYGYYY